MLSQKTSPLFNHIYQTPCVLFLQVKRPRILHRPGHVLSFQASRSFESLSDIEDNGSRAARTQGGLFDLRYQTPLNMRRDRTYTRNHSNRNHAWGTPMEAFHWRFYSYKYGYKFVKLKRLNHRQNLHMPRQLCCRRMRKILLWANR